MRNKENTDILSKEAWFSTVFLLLFIASFTIAILTYLYRHLAGGDGWIAFAVRHHLEIMIAVIFVSLAFGFFWSRMLSVEIERGRKTTQSVIDIVYLFLNADEKSVIRHLVEKGGRSSQAELSRLEGMTRVRIFRVLQRMQQKNLISITSHGKVRYVQLRDDLKSYLFS